MADELQYYGNPSNQTGLTVVARVYNAAGTQVGTDVSCTEVGSLAIYQGDMPSAGAGLYGVRFFDGTTLLGQGTIDWDGTDEVDQHDILTAVEAGGGGGGASAEAIADAVWAEDLSADATTDTAADLLKRAKDHSLAANRQTQQV